MALPTSNAKTRTPKEEMERNLRLMMDHVGLADVPVAALGGNHPEAWRDEAEVDGTLGRMPRHRLDKARDASLEITLPPEPSDDPDPVEQAIRMQILMREKKLNVTELARELGRSRAYVRNHLRLLSMPNAIVEHVRAGRLSEGHARVLAKMRDPEAIARLIIRRQLSVRQTEVIARRLRYIGPDGQLLADTAIPNSKFAEDILEDALGAKVRIKDRAGHGIIEVHYRSPNEARALFQGLTKMFAGLSPEDMGMEDGV